MILVVCCCRFLAHGAKYSRHMSAQAKTDETPLLRAAATVATSELKKVKPLLHLRADLKIPPIEGLAGLRSMDTSQASGILSKADRRASLWSGECEHMVH